MLAVGQSIGNYQITRLLGEGGMGQVFEAEQQEIGKRVAIKTLHAELMKYPEAASRFLNEARAVNLIKHPSIVTIFEYGKLPDGIVYIVMEFLEGESLTQRINSGSLTIPAAMRLSRQIAAALQAAHDKSIVHRDLKPDNIFIVPDPEAAAGERAKILDFGIAKLAEEHQGPKSLVKTQAGALMGTPLYMSPEQCDGAGQVDAKSDVYALGIILYEMLTGSPPFTGSNVGAVMMKQVSSAPRPIREVNPIVPEPLSLLIHSMLAKVPVERPTMLAVAKELERLSAQKSPAHDALAEVDQPPAVSKSMAGVAPVEPVATMTGDELAGGPVVSQPAQPIVKITNPPPEPVAETPAEAPVDAPKPSAIAPPVKRANRMRIFAPVGLGVAVLLAVGAFFTLRPNKVRVSVQIVGEIGAGQVISEPAGIDCGDICSTKVAKRSELSLVAKAAPGYVFAGWSGDCTGTAACRLEPRWEQKIEARFARDPAAGAGRPAGTSPSLPPSRGPVKKGATMTRRP